jgi:DNA-directed RNA polymerase subunit RPC12/RpoP
MMVNKAGDIVKIPPTDKWLGSCPECGKPIWVSYLMMEETIFNQAVYKCIECDKLVIADTIIPF